jgi:hypothetical protein
MRTGTEAPNPVCTEDDDLPPPPAIDWAHDPAAPHPDEPGVDGIGAGGLTGCAPEAVAEIAREG